MRRVVFALLAAVFLLLLSGPAWASDLVGTVDWTGNGSDNLPCTSGGHWVLAPAFGVESATLTVNGTDYTMEQSGQGSWSADSVGAITNETEAYVTYTGEGDERDHLQLSHCTDTPPPTSPPPTTPPPTTPPPTTPPPTSPPTTPPGGTHGSTHTPPPASHVTYCVAHPKAESCVQAVAFTGLSRNAKAAVVAGACLLVLGSLALRLSSRKRKLDG